MSNRPVNHYEALGVKATATSAEIKSAFYELSKQYHPDLNPDDKDKAAEQFQKVAAAYEILGNETKRKEYDRNFGQPRRTRANPYDHSEARRRRGNFHQSSAEFRDFDRQFREFASRQNREEFNDPDEFFKKFGNRKFKSRLDFDDIPPDYKTYNDAQAKARDAEELRIRREIEMDKLKRPFPIPTFEQMARDELARKRLDGKDTWKMIVMGLIIIFFGHMVSRPA
ncbi:unnamed protein product [Bursaphelenchus xylophilus]|nr:unnamed protein product [Bursaphelenchus xylophilus]CAG9113058.1 unnamed protein product [Bursaphelenchus xylophilus]